MNNEKILEEFDCFGECTECEVCEYFGYLDWAATVGKPEGSAIEENIRVETYLKKKEASIHQAIAEERARMVGEIEKRKISENNFDLLVMEYMRSGTLDTPEFTIRVLQTDFNKTLDDLLSSLDTPDKD